MHIDFQVKQEIHKNPMSFWLKPIKGFKNHTPRSISKKHADAFYQHLAVDFSSIRQC